MKTQYINNDLKIRNQRKKEFLARNTNIEQIINNEQKRKMDQGRIYSYADWGPAES